jgi:hypothetical protein
MVENRRNHIPEPVLLNGMKHHAGFLADFILNFDTAGAEKTSLLKHELAIIGTSQMDFYTGFLTPLEIGLEISEYLKKNQIHDEYSYLTFLEKQKNSYRVVILSDGSGWILLAGKLKGRHVHIHPGRDSLHTIRVRSETMKSAIAILCYSERYRKDPFDITLVNEVRVNVLRLPPVRIISGSMGLGKLIGILTTRLQMQKSLQ